MKACLIDDDQIFLFGMKRMLEVTDLSQQTLQFSNGYEALNFLRDAKSDENSLPDVIFLDINMPVMDGWQFIDEYARLKDSFAKNITVYMVSSSIDYADAERARGIDAIAQFMVKPLSLQQIKDLFPQPTSSN